MKYWPTPIVTFALLTIGIPAQAVENITVTREYSIEVLSGFFSLIEVRRYTRLSRAGHDVFLDEPDLFPPLFGPPSNADLNQFRDSPSSTVQLGPFVIDYQPGNETGAQIECNATIWSDYVDTAHNTDSQLVDLNNGLLKVLTLDMATGELLAEDGTVVAILDRPELISYPQGC